MALALTQLEKNLLGACTGILLFSCSFGGAFGQVLSSTREATNSDYVDKLPAEKKDAIVVISGDKGNGTGFFARIKDNVFLVTNMHVLDGQSTIKATSMDGAPVHISGIYAARDADIALLKLAEAPKAYFETEASVNTAHKAGDPVLVPGNSLGGGTILQTEGRIVALGPLKIEHDAPTFHGNSGSPILSATSWKVLGVDTESVVVTLGDRGDAASAKDSGSQIKSAVRLFGYRLDTVSQWDAIDWGRFSQQSKKLEAAEALVTAVHAVLNQDMDGWQKHPSTSAMMMEFKQLINKPRITTVEIRTKAETVVLNFRNALKKVEMEAVDSKMTCYGYISMRYKNLASYASLVREALGADNVR